MDLRVKKTRQNIRNAFIELRSKKPVAKITVKELCELAVINKTTFYLHYQSIYELSETIENEFIESCFSKIKNADIKNPEKIVMELYRTFSEQRDMFRILFSDSHIEYPAHKANAFIKENICNAYPELKDNAEFSIALTALVYGCFYAYMENRDSDVDMVMHYLATLVSRALQDIRIS